MNNTVSIEHVCKQLAIVSLVLDINSRRKTTGYYSAKICKCPCIQH